MASKKLPQITSKLIDDLTGSADIVDTISHRVPDLKKKGRDYKACCPFHRESTPSFTVSPTHQFYHCFGCGAHGDVIDFIMEHDMLSFREAIEDLSAEIGFPLSRYIVEYKAEPLSIDLFTLLESISEYYTNNLKGHPQKEGVSNFLANQGIDEATAERYNLGFALNSPNDVKRRFGTTKKRLEQLFECGSIITVSGSTCDRFSNRLMFGVQDRRGRVLGFGSTSTYDGRTGQYITSPDTNIFHSGKELYGLYQLRKAVRNPKEILVVRDYLDVVRLAAKGIPNAVAPPGCDITKDHLAKLIRCAPVITFVFNENNHDRAVAWNYVNKILPVLGGDFEVRFVFMEEGKTIEGLLSDGKSNEFLEITSKSEPFSRYFLSHLDGLINEEDNWTEKLRSLAAPYLKLLRPGVYKQLLTQEITGNLSSPILYQENESRYAAEPEKKVPTISYSDTLESRVLAILINHPELVGELPDNDLLNRVDSEHGALLRDVASYLEDLSARDIPPATALIIERFRGHKLSHVINDMACRFGFDEEVSDASPEMIALSERLAISAQVDTKDDMDSLFLKPISSLTPKEREQLKKAKVLPRPKIKRFG